MQPRDYHSAARRWAKFPAAILFILAVVWLIQNFFELNWAEIGAQTRTGLGSVLVFLHLVVIPLGSILIGVCVMFLQRWALWGAGVIALYPLMVKTFDLAARIDAKFTLYRQGGEISEFGGGIMTALELVAIWALYGIVLYHLYKALYWHARARQWVKRPTARPAAKGQVSGGGQPRSRPIAEVDEGDVCLLLPNTQEEQED
ncbi:hypothetical protein JW859_00575 [bacterium]|nr:hypothetical protein [bacterium]